MTSSTRLPITIPVLVRFIFKILDSIKPQEFALYILHRKWFALLNSRVCNLSFILWCYRADSRLHHKKSLRATLLTDLILPHYFSISAVSQLSLHTINPCIVRSKVNWMTPRCVTPIFQQARTIPHLSNPTALHIRTQQEYWNNTEEPLSQRAEGHKRPNLETQWLGRINLIQQQTWHDVFRARISAPVEDKCEEPKRGRTLLCRETELASGIWAGIKRWGASP